jgi:hypothetical protein
MSLRPLCRRPAAQLTVTRGRTVKSLRIESECILERMDKRTRGVDQLLRRRSGFGVLVKWKSVGSISTEKMTKEADWPHGICCSTVHVEVAWWSTATEVESLFLYGLKHEAETWLLSCTKRSADG